MLVAGFLQSTNAAPNFLSQRVPRLLEGNMFEFRVFAVNAQGRGAPTTSDEAMPQAQSDVPGKQGRPFAVDADKLHQNQLETTHPQWWISNYWI